jgi:DNA-binding transcriptional regulator GbsR (MarR family)
MAADDIHSELSRARDLGIDTCGRIAEFWGFTRTMGRAFGLLYLSGEPLPQADLQKRLGISTGSASMTLAALGRWGVVHRVWVRGQRREHYQAETDFWKMIAGVLNERERREIGAAVEVVERAEAGARAAQAAARAQAPGAAADAKKLRSEADFTVERLARLREICRLGETMLDMLLGQLTLDVGKFRHVLRVDAPAPAAPPEAARPAPPARKSAVKTDVKTARPRTTAASAAAPATSGPGKTSAQIKRPRR